MSSNGALQKRCMSCGKTSAELGQRLKRCARCGGGGLDVYYCNEHCQAADWESHRSGCKKLPPGVDGRALRTHITSWFRVYKPLLEWAIHQASLTKAGDYDSNGLFLVMELGYFEGAPERDVPCLHSTRLMIHPPPLEGQTSLPGPFKEEGAKIIQCTLMGCVITHKCATFDSSRSKRPCSRWNYVVADTVALGFQIEEQMKESLPLVITRHNMFEAFVGEGSRLRRDPFPRLSRSLPAELRVGPWIWIKDPVFIAWFTEATGKTVAARVAELGAQASQDKCLEILLQWAMNPEAPTLEGLGMRCSSMDYHLGSSHHAGVTFESETSLLSD